MIKTNKSKKTYFFNLFVFHPGSNPIKPNRYRVQNLTIEGSITKRYKMTLLCQIFMHTNNWSRINFKVKFVHPNTI